MNGLVLFEWLLFSCFQLCLLFSVLNSFLYVGRLNWRLIKVLFYKSMGAPCKNISKKKTQYMSLVIQYKTCRWYLLKLMKLFMYLFIDNWKKWKLRIEISLLAFFCLLFQTHYYIKWMWTGQTSFYQFILGAPLTRHKKRSSSFNLTYGRPDQNRETDLTDKWLEVLFQNTLNAILTGLSIWV